MLTTIYAVKNRPTHAVVAIAAVLAIAIDAQASLAAGPGLASQLDAHRHLDLSRSQLQALYPDLPSRELDLFTFRIADINSMKGAPVAGPTGDWFCTSDTAGLFRLTTRATSYSLVGGTGPAMAGEYTLVDRDVEITSGPLKGMGMVHGTVASEQDGRVLSFRSEGEATLGCREVL